jgi:SAM-dependent methyltransferase
MNVTDQNQLARELLDFAHEMKRDWDERARQNARWFINSGRHRQSLQIMPSEDLLRAEGREDTARLLLDDLASLLPGSDPRTLRIFEIGCGIGRMTEALAETFGEVCATDISGEMLKQARAHVAKFPHVSLFETNGLDFANLPDAHFDIVFSAYVFQHVPDLAVTRALLSEAYRVLKPGGVLKFNVNGIGTLGFEEIAHDTWVGAPFPESELRGWAREAGARLICLQDAGTQECWVTLRKPAPDAGAAARQTTSSLLIENFGHADDLNTKEIPIKGSDARLALIVSGLDCETRDCNSLAVEINGEEVLPCYVGPVKPQVAEALRRTAGGAPLTPGQFAQVEARIPVGEMDELVAVRVKLDSRQASQPVTVALYVPQPTQPQIDRVVNRADEGSEVHARGPKSALTLYVAGLDVTADTGNIRVQVGPRIIKPGYVSATPREGVHRVDVQLPDDVTPGATELKLYFGNLESPTRSVVIEG